MSEPATPRLAASVIVLRPQARQFEVLLARRPDDARSFAGATVFPGGVVESRDGFDDDRLLRVAACRELFEETGILLAEPEPSGALPPGEDLVHARHDVHAGEIDFLDYLAARSLRCRTDLLVPFARWITPEAQPRRWDTWFFLAPAPEGQSATADGIETTEVAWRTPRHALDDYVRGEVDFAPPTFRILEDLAAHTDLDAVWRASKDSDPPAPILPVPLDGARMVTLVYPGDRDHPESPGTGRNRVMLENGRWKSARDDTP